MFVVLYKDMFLNTIQFPVEFYSSVPLGQILLYWAAAVEAMGQISPAINTL